MSDSSIEFEFELEPVRPESAQDATRDLQAEIQAALVDSDLAGLLVKKPDYKVEQNLPLTKEGVEIVLLTVTFIMKTLPENWDQLKAFFRSLAMQRAKKSPPKVSGKIKLGDKEIVFKGLDVEDTIRVLTQNGGEFIYRPAQPKKP